MQAAKGLCAIWKRGFGFDQQVNISAPQAIIDS